MFLLQGDRVVLIDNHLEIGEGSAELDLEVLDEVLVSDKVCSKTQDCLFVTVHNGDIALPPIVSDLDLFLELFVLILKPITTGLHGLETFDKLCLTLTPRPFSIGENSQESNNDDNESNRHVITSRDR